MKFNFQVYIAGLGVLLALFLAGCGILGESVDKNFTSRTRITYTDGTRTVTYDSTKDQQVDYITNPDNSLKELHIKSVTPESAIASQAESLAKSQAANAEIVKAIAPIAGAAFQGAIEGGIFGGGPGAGAGAVAGAAKAAAAAKEKANAGAAPAPANP